MAAFEESAATSISAQEIYTWTFPGAPVRIQLHLNVVESLGREVKRAFESVPSHSVEIGGILYGIADFAASPTIEIKDFEPFLCEYRSDHRFMLSDSDHRKLERLLAARRADGPEALSVVGYYRAHIGEGLSLRSEDLTVAQAHFFDPANVFLLVKPAPDGSMSAGFFFWDKGRIDADFTYLEFPFDARQLTGARHKPAPPADLEPMSTPPLQAEPHRRGVHTAWEPPPSPSWREERPEITRRTPRAGGWRLAFFAVLIAVLGGLGYQYQDYLKWPQRNSAASDASPLSLQAQRKGADLHVSWNRNSPIIMQATEAVLSIRDGSAQQQALHLNADQLRSGSVTYTPANPTVQFRLETIGPGNTKTEETVLVVSAARPATPDSSQSAGGPSPQPDAAAATSPGSAQTPEQPASAQPPKEVPPPAAQKRPASTDASALYIEPRPVRRVQPVLPRGVRNLIAARVEVPVRVWITDTGTVRKAEPEPTGQLVSSTLITAAQHAAMRWRFAPAVRGTDTVPSELILKFQYTPVRR